MAEPAASIGPNGRLRLFTIGFTQKSAEQFFTLLIAAGVRRVADVRLNNISQLPGNPRIAPILRSRAGN